MVVVVGGGGGGGGRGGGGRGCVCEHHNLRLNRPRGNLRNIPDRDLSFTQSQPILMTCSINMRSESGESHCGCRNGWQLCCLPKLG